jgi:hypothetical protein
VVDTDAAASPGWRSQGELVVQHADFVSDESVELRRVSINKRSIFREDRAYAHWLSPIGFQRGFDLAMGIIVGVAHFALDIADVLAEPPIPTTD